jgi:type IV pilus assembly protein PilV
MNMHHTTLTKSRYKHRVSRAISPLSSQTGFAILEAMICVVLISFAFLASAGLHLSSLRDTQSSGQVIQAVQLANDLQERMRVNFQKADSYMTITKASYANCNTTTGCTANEMVANDLQEWADQVAARLPGGLGVVCRDSSPGDGTSPSNSDCSSAATDPFAIKIWWNLRDSAGGAGPTAARQRQVLSFIARP